MKILCSVLYKVLFLAVLCPCYAGAADLVLNNAVTNVYFSPDGGAQKAIIRHIDEATREILVQAYLFTSKPIQSALIRAHKRGVEVEMVLDRADQKDRKYVTAKAFKAGGTPVWLDSKHPCSHNKIMIIDREKIITGSFNFTYSAEARNAENILVISSPDLAALYTDNFLKHRQHSTKY